MKKILLGLFAAAVSIAPLYAFTQTAHAAASLERLAGADRYATAVAISKKAFPVDGSAKAVYLYNADNAVDALAAAPLTQINVTSGEFTYDIRGPLLPVKGGTELTAEVKAELVRVLPGAPDYAQITILGGTAAVSDDALNDLPKAGLASSGYTVRRFNGENRYETAAMVADEIQGSMVGSGTHIPNMYIVNGESVADALGVAPLAAARGDVILLSYRNAAPSSVLAYMDRQTGGTITMVGGTAVLSKSLQESLSLRHWGTADLADRYDGANRYETARIVADRFNVSGTPLFATGVGLANGATLVDALPAAVLLAKMYKPMLLVSSKHILTCPTGDFLLDNASLLEDGFVFGGTDVVSDTIKHQAESLMDGDVLVARC